jgi:hypothetical protein
MRYGLLGMVALLLCNQAVAVTGNEVIDAFKAAGIEVVDAKNVTEDTQKSEGPLPKSFRENWVFVNKTLKNGKGGQIFICDEKKYCDAIYAYFDVLKGMAGPYLYQSKDGLIVAQINSGHLPDSAKRYEKVLADLVK